jgi:hypothetical protein
VGHTSGEYVSGFSIGGPGTTSAGAVADAFRPKSVPHALLSADRAEVRGFIRAAGRAPPAGMTVR